MAIFPSTAITGTSTIDDPSSVHIWKNESCTSPTVVENGGSLIAGKPDLTLPTKKMSNIFVFSTSCK